MLTMVPPVCANVPVLNGQIREPPVPFAVMVPVPDSVYRTPTLGWRKAVTMFPPVCRQSKTAESPVLCTFQSLAPVSVPAE